MVVEVNTFGKYVDSTSILLYNQKMFAPVSKRLAYLSTLYPEKIVELEHIFDNKTNVYIDYANIRPWAIKLGWHIDLRRLKQLLNSFDTVHEVKFYNGTLVGDELSERIISEARSLGYVVKTKPVKIMRLSIDVTSIAANSPDLLKDFVRKPLLKKLKIETIETLNNELRALNQQGILHVDDMKSNFDVEIGRDMLRDYDTAGLGISYFGVGIVILLGLWKSCLLMVKRLYCLEQCGVLQVSLMNFVQKDSRFLMCKRLKSLFVIKRKCSQFLK